MWMVTQDEAIEMYARMFRARHGRAASKLARKTALSLESKGDHEGHDVWNEVADTIDREQQGKRPH
jgi:hypothetical protein